MRTETRKLRLKLLAEIDSLSATCKVCEIRKRYDDAKDATGLSRVCKECPIGQELATYGSKLICR